MATLNLGRIKPVFQGAYNNSTAYVVDDIVTFGNETFICILASTGNATSNATYWTKLAAKGTDGTDVGTTLTTHGDILYRDGSGLQRLAAGTSGQFLKTQGTGANPVWSDNTADYIRIASSKVAGSSTSAVIFDQAITSSHNLYRLTGVYKITGGSPMLRFQYRTGTSGSESNFSGGNYHYINNAYQDSSGSARGNSNAGGNTHCDLDNDSGDAIWNVVDVVFTFPNAGNSEANNSWSGTTFHYRDNSSVFFRNNIAGFLGSSINPTGFRIFTDSGVFTAKTNFKLFGMRE